MSGICTLVLVSPGRVKVYHYNLALSTRNGENMETVQSFQSPPVGKRDVTVSGQY